jgi:hypothetical protein
MTLYMIFILEVYICLSHILWWLLVLITQLPTGFNMNYIKGRAKEINKWSILFFRKMLHIVLLEQISTS